MISFGWWCGLAATIEFALLLVLAARIWRQQKDIDGLKNELARERRAENEIRQTNYKNCNRIDEYRKAIDFTIEQLKKVKSL